MFNPEMSSFGEIVVVENRPFIQAVPVNNFLPANFNTYTSNNGIATVQNHEFVCQTGTTAYGYGAIQSFRSLNYRAGQGGMARFTARFPTGGVANCWQGVGLVNLGNELSFGYDGTEFGTWYRHGGVAEVQTLTITAGASGAETATVTIDGTEYQISLTSGTTAANATTIANYITTNISTWEAFQVDNIVQVISLSDGPKGTFAFAISEGGTCAASWAETTTGVTKTSDFTSYRDWNLEKFPGLNPAYGNVYQIKYQYLGYGNLIYYVENATSGRFVPVHQIEYPNQHSTPSVGSPNFRMGAYAASVGSQTNVTVASASMAAFLQGRENSIRNPRSYSRVKTGLTTTINNIFTIRNRRIVNGEVNNGEITPLQLSLFTESSKGATFYLYTNTILGGTTNYTQTGTNLMSDVDIAGTTISGGTLLGQWVVQGNSLVVDLKSLDIVVPPTLTLTIAAKVNSGAAADTAAALIWYEGV